MTNPNSSPHRKRRLWPWITLASVILIPIAVFAVWASVTLNYTYSSGDRAGFIQKLSKKGWVCKTWEGELAMANLPGSMPQIFTFSVRNDSVAGLIERDMGKRVSLTYEEHRGVPTKCFGETQYFVTNVKLAEP